ncbi:DsbA family protein [Pseudolysinimonas sp.]
MNSNARIALIFSGLFIFVVIVAVVVAIVNRPAPTVPETNPDTALPSTVRDDTHRLSEGSTDIVLVEFLDFECEACGAFYPVVEELRAEYGDRITFAFRYFPLPGHGNSTNAAVAVEAAFRQGQLEAMYSRMFETQAVWGEKGAESQAPLFRQYAEELGLDLTQYDADVADPEVLARVQSDFEDGVGLGVESTPTFFLDDRRVELTSFDDLRAALEAALAE